MVTEKDIRWGSYREYEGAWFGGKIKYVPPVNMDFRDKCLAVLTATEGSAYDAVNMYDRCILSVGLIQWCDALPQGSVTKILGNCAELDSFMMETKIKQFPVPVSFKKNAKGEWRFFLQNGTEVNTPDLQRLLYFGAAHRGKVGTWGPEGSPERLYAKKVAAWFANLWDWPLFRTVQAERTKAKIESFAMPESKEILFKDRSRQAEEGWSGALRAAFLSFAGNIPVTANNSLKKAVAHPDWPNADAADRFRIALQHLTFAPNIAIYPGRYNKIAPVISKLFHVTIPLTHQELKAWKDAPPVVPLSTEEEELAKKLNDLLGDVKAGVCSLPLADSLLGKVCKDVLE